MATMFKAEVIESESTGAGYGREAHVYVSGHGIALSKSPKKAIRQATTLCRQQMFASCKRQLGMGGIGLIPIFSEIQLFRDGKLIHEAD